MVKWNQQKSPRNRNTETPKFGPRMDTVQSDFFSAKTTRCSVLDKWTSLFRRTAPLAQSITHIWWRDAWRSQ